MRNSNDVPSQLGLPAESLGLMPAPLIGRPAFLLLEDRKCGANLMEGNRIDD
jgi:hypothetical protein